MRMYNTVRFYDLCFYLGRLFLTSRLSEMLSCPFVLAVESVDHEIFLRVP